MENNKLLEFKVTPIALEYFSQRSFEIIFDVFNNIENSSKELIKDYLLSIDNNQFYDSLKFHNDVIYSTLITSNYELLDEFIIWKYSMSFSRGINIDYFLEEYSFWKESITKYLYPSHASEINNIYDYLINKHFIFKNELLNIKDNDIDEENKEIFNSLLDSILLNNKEKFYEIVKNNLNKFDGSIFVFVEKLITPLMYKIGKMWQLNEINIAKEHLATSFVDDVVMELLRESINISKNTRVALISTIGDETHNLGTKILGKYLESLGYNVKNLSSKISNRELFNSVLDLNPDLVLLSVTLHSNVSNLKKIVKDLKQDSNIFSGKIIVGGQAIFLSNNKKIDIEEADLITKDFDELKAFLNLI